MDKSVWCVAPGGATLALFAYRPTLVDAEQPRRTYAACGGVYIVPAIASLQAISSQKTYKDAMRRHPLSTRLSLTMFAMWFWPSLSMDAFAVARVQGATRKLRVTGLIASASRSGQALATSVDVAAAGLTLRLVSKPIPVACFIIGATTTRLSSRTSFWVA